jgi:hypothetical protein
LFFFSKNIPTFVIIIRKMSYLFTSESVSEGHPDKVVNQQKNIRNLIKTETWQTRGHLKSSYYLPDVTLYY